MAKRPTIYESITGYSRYDLPQNIAFTATAGLLYPARVQFCNAADKVTLGAELFLRANAMTVPTFNPFSVRLHRFWVPMRLYHPDMRVNLSGFDMTVSTQNYITHGNFAGTEAGDYPPIFPYYLRCVEPRSLLSMLRLSSGYAASVPYQARNTYSRGSNRTVYQVESYDPNSVNTGVPRLNYFNADCYLAYWDIVRQFYSFSQWGDFSMAWPLSFVPVAKRDAATKVPSDWTTFVENPTASRWTQVFGNLSDLDDYYENSFFPRSVVPTSTSFTGYNRASLFACLAFASDPDRSSWAASGGDYTDWLSYWSLFNQPAQNYTTDTEPFPSSDISSATTSNMPRFTIDNVYYTHHPLAVVPASPDRYSRVLPVRNNTSVNFSRLQTVPQLAYASRLQEYRDLLSAGESRFDAWLREFFGTRLDFQDTPTLLFSQSLGMGARPMFNMSGNPGEGLGQFGGELSIQGQVKKESYFFREPGYLIDLISIRPFYYWSCVQADYARMLTGSDYFNPKFNDLGYQVIPSQTFWSARGMFMADYQNNTTDMREPIFNEFRGTYDEALGGYASIAGLDEQFQPDKVYQQWVMQRYVSSAAFTSSPTGEVGASASPLFRYVDIAKVNAPFASNIEDNFHIALAYDVDLRTRVSKTFVTRLNTR